MSSPPGLKGGWRSFTRRRDRISKCTRANEAELHHAMKRSTTPSPRSPRCGPVAALLLGAALLLTGCVSTKYKMAPKNTPPPIALNLATVQPPVAAVLHTVIVYQGPGSWKKTAYWDEYVVSITNQGPGPLTIESALLVDALNAEQLCGSNPWELEALSRENLKKFEHYGRKIMIGAGLTTGWALSGGLVAAGAWVGDAALVSVAGAVFVALPVWALGSGVRILVARGSITDEFNRRRIALPLALKPGATKQGSFFFPISPGPRQLALRCRANGVMQPVTLDLTPLAGLHLLKQLSEVAPASTAKP